MNDIVLSNADLAALRSSTKSVKNPRARWSDEPGRHQQRNFDLETEDGELSCLYQRQNVDDPRDFSCGLAWIHKAGRRLSLIRYNGSSHLHGDIRYRCHIQRATEEALVAGTTVDSFAEETDRYTTLGGALACRIEDCAVQGLTAQPDQWGLFDGP